MPSKGKHEDKTNPDRRRGVKPYVFPMREDGNIVASCTAMEVNGTKEVVIVEWLNGDITCSIDEGNE